MIAVVVLALSLGGCSELSHEQPHLRSPARQGADLQQGPANNGTMETRRPCVGAYHADRISGDYAGYGRLQAFIEQMVQQHGFDRAYLQGLFSQAKRKDWTLDYYRKSDQAIKGKPAQGSWTRYRAQFLEERRIASGVDFARRYRATLQRASRQYGVPEEYILGIMAVETNFGGNMGNHRVIDALTTLGFDYARRGDFFRDELEQFLLMARSEGIDPSQPKGSFAGAMGYGQFMPSSFRKWAVDFNGDGHRDLWNPEDAIGSIANYFAQHGWQAGRPVVLPLTAAGPVALETGFDTRYSLETLRQSGLRPSAPCEGSQFCLLQLRHQQSDQYLLGYPNFYTITRYNHSTHYAMAVHELAQVIKQRI